MTLDRVRQFLAIQVSLGGGCNANSARLVLSGIQKEHGQAVVDQLIREMGLAGFSALSRAPFSTAALH